METWKFGKKGERGKNIKGGGKKGKDEIGKRGNKIL